MDKKTTVAVAYDLHLQHAGELFRGVSDHAREAALDWHLVPLQYGFETILMQLAQSGQLSGAIGHFISDRWVAGLLACRVRAINLFGLSHIQSIPSVCLEDFEMGQQAAEHLLSQGANRFIFFTSASLHANTLRQKGFTKTLANRPCTILKPGPQLAQSIKAGHTNTSRPGVFCTSDRLARDYILQARRLGLEPGKDYLLASIGNDPTESIFSGTRITSFEPPMYTCGKLAAKLLQQSLSADTPPEPAVTIARGAKLIKRESSLPSRASRIAQAAINRINQHFHDPELDAAALAKAVGTSRRILELSMKEAQLPSPYKLITRTRLREARRLLCNTDLPVSEVGRFCGYPEPHHFSTWFKARTGQAPRTYRQQNRKPPSV